MGKGRNAEGAAAAVSPADFTPPVRLLWTLCSLLVLL